MNIPGKSTIQVFSEGLKQSLFQGKPSLGRIIAFFFSYLMRRKVDPWKEVLVTIGASNALALAARAFFEEGEEVMIFEPVYLMLKTAILNVCTAQNKEGNDWSIFK